MAYKQPSSGSTFKMMGSSPMKQTKEIKGTSIFGKSPKNFAVDALKNMTGYNAVKSVYDKISGSKTDYSKKTAPPQHEVMHPTMGLEKKGKKRMMKKEFKQLKKKQGLKDSMKKSLKHGASEGVSEAMQQLSQEKMRVLTNKMKPKGKRTMTDKTKMKPPYKKPVGPRAS